MTRLVFTTSLVAFFLISVVNYAASQVFLKCDKELDGCISRCPNQKTLSDQYECNSSCYGISIECLRSVAVGAEYRAKELLEKAKEERKKITCTPARGNEQRCIQHGQDLMPAVPFKGGDAIACDDQYSTCKDNCNNKAEPDVCRAGCEVEFRCLKGAAASTTIE